MKRKLFALAAAAVFGVMSVGALAACDGKKSAPPPHVCEHVCPEPDCGKCLDAECADPVCADKCGGHIFTVTFELDGGLGAVDGASYKPGDTFELPTGDGLTKEACTLIGWTDGTTEYEAAHGTVTKHYYRHLKGEKTSTNSMATIFAWSGALRRRGELDGLQDLADFANRLEQACFDTLNAGIMTKDLVGLVEPGFEARAVNSEEFLDAIAQRLAQ